VPSYYVCEKSDGVRYLLYSTSDDQNQEAHYLIDRKNDYWYIPQSQLHIPTPTDEQGFHTNTITDGELVWDVLDSGEREPRFLIFDCLVNDGVSLMDKTLDKRLGLVQANIFDPYNTLFKKYPEERQYQAFFLEMKPFQLAYGIEMMFKEILPKLKHGNDGLIFTCRNTPYKHGTDPHILKWKPPEENTMDCRLRLFFPTVAPDEDERADGVTEPFVDYDSVPRAELWIFTGDSGPDKYEYFDEVLITKEEWEVLKGLGDPLNDRIVECNQDEHGRWRIMRFRDDKLEANHKSTVLSVLDSINDRISYADLVKAAPRIRDSWKARAARK
jgi:mRNA guanylyltransferase